MDSYGNHPGLKNLFRPQAYSSLFRQSWLLNFQTLPGNRQVGLVNCSPNYSTTPVSMTRRLTPWIIVERACGNNDLLSAARLVRHGAIAALADLPRKASRFRQIVA